MSTIQEIEAAIARLSREELATFRQWFEQFDAKAWDSQLEKDISAGQLDALADEALEDFRKGHTTEL